MCTRASLTCLQPTDVPHLVILHSFICCIVLENSRDASFTASFALTVNPNQDGSPTTCISTTCSSRCERYRSYAGYIKQAVMHRSDELQACHRWSVPRSFCSHIMLYCTCARMRFDGDKNRRSPVFASRRGCSRLAFAFSAPTALQQRPRLTNVTSALSQTSVCIRAGVVKV
ncbi:hypothetical protein EJ03DRAFT_46164 [Teratosphaeria nubilosa]|uniref:Uncharacterized protein n=1 Tax=Teratosphaeria nubilosa TaxID=161662 RepID=A0A6G1LDX2_9PEZI|nr:hypothetical protein EJ03DRAFT_46164 [Teratosphaeria nubilosa]